MVMDIKNLLGRCCQSLGCLASDVLFGSAIGFAVGSLVYFNTNKTLQIIPISSTGMGVALIYHF